MNFTNNGKYFMVRCPVCNRENYAPAVATGTCAWCGHSETVEKRRKNENND